MDIDDVKDEWKMRYKEASKKIEKAVKKNSSKKHQINFQCPNITDFTEAYQIKKELE